MTDTDNIFGKPINGDISHRSGGMVEQHDPAELVAALDAALARPEVVAIRWEQSTPYFNDGDPCEFGIYEARTKFVNGDEEGGDYEDGYLDSWGLTYVDDKGNRPYAQEGLEVSETTLEALKAVNAAVAGGHHYAILNQMFGDPAQVTATADGFDVEYYEHD